MRNDVDPAGARAEPRLLSWILLASLLLSRPLHADTIIPEVVSSFATPGGAILGMTWGDGSLWLADENQVIYRLNTDGEVQSQFSHTISEITDLAWFENTIWAHDGSNVYKLNLSGAITETLDVGYWPSSGMQWAEGSLYVGNYNFGDIHKHDRAGNHIFSWPTNFFGHPEDMIYDGSSLWITDSCEGGNNAIYQYSLTGQPGDVIDASDVDACETFPDRALAWDGRYFWFAGRLTVYQLDTSGDDVPPVASVVSPSGGEYWLLSDEGATPNSEVITWAMSDNVRICQARVSLWYSNDGGATYDEAAAGGGLPATFGPGGECTGAGELTTSMTYTIPTEPPSGATGSLYKIQLEVMDAAGNPLAVDPGSGLNAVRSTNPFYIVRPNPDSVRTLILKNTARMQSIMGITGTQAAALDLKLQELAEHPRVQGLVIDLAAITDVSELYAAWDADSDNPLKANAVLFGCHAPYPAGCPTDRERRGIHDQIRGLLVAIDGSATYSGVKYLVLAGDDRIIPMARLQDRTLLLPESSYPVGGDIRSIGTRVGAALASGKYLTDDPLATLDPIATGDVDGNLFLPDLGVGRLVETPEEIATTIASYISQDGILDLSALDATTGHKVLISGYDFLSNVAVDMRSRWKNALGISTPNSSTQPVAGNLIGGSWGLGSIPDRRNALRTALAGNGGARYGIMAIAGHATHYEEGVPGTNPFDIQGLSTADIYGPDACATATLGPIGLAGAVIYGLGCHGGLNVAGSCRTDADHSLDLPQTFLSRGVVAYVANTGYGWGLKHGIGYGARLLQIFTEQLTSTGTIVTGDAVRLSKQRYYLETPRYDAYDEKTAMQWTLYGLPMYAVKTGIGEGASFVTTDRIGAIGVSRQLAGDGPYAIRSLAAIAPHALPSHLTQLNLSFDLTAEGVYDKHDSTGAVLPTGTGCPDPNGCYYTLNGLVDRGTGSSDVPIQPYLIYDSRLAGTSQHGVLWKGGTYDEESGWKPVIAELISNGGDASNHGSAPRIIRLRPTAPRVVPGVDSPSCRPSDLEVNSLTLVAGEAVKPQTGALEYSITRRYRTMDLEVLYYNNRTTPANNCDREGPALATGPYAGNYHSVGGSLIQWSVPASDAAGVWRVLVVYTTNLVDQQGRGSWVPLELTHTGGGTFAGSTTLTPGTQVTYVIEAVDNRGNVTWLDWVTAQLPASGVPLGIPHPIDVLIGQLQVPAAVVATATTATSVAVTWNAVTGADGYDVYRRDSGAGYVMIGSSGTTGYTDNTAIANKSYLYRVRAKNGATQSGDSSADLATTVIFTDPVLTIGVTKARSVHVEQLRTAVNAVRVLAGLGNASFTDPVLTIGVTKQKAAHVVELRTALAAARSALGLAAASYTDPTLTAGATRIKAAHITDLRNAVR